MTRHTNNDTSPRGETRDEKRDKTLRDFMKDVREENRELGRMPAILPQTSGSEAAETAVGECQTAQ